MRTPIIEINDFKGGMTLNPKLGRADQFEKGWNIDFSSKPGFLAPGYAWQAHTYAGSTNLPTEFRHIIHTIRDGNIYLGGENTIIYYKSTGETIDIGADSDQTGMIKGMAEYKNYLYYAQDTTIGRKDLSVAVTAGYTHNWQIALNTADFHPIFVSTNLKMYIGLADDVGSWDGTTFTAAALDLGDNWKIRCLDDFGYLYLAIGANYYTGSYKSSKCKIFLWDRTSPSWNDEIEIPEPEIKAIKYGAGYLWVWAGRSGNVYVVPEGSRKATKVWTFVKESPIQDFEVYPGAVLIRGGTIFFGLSDVDTVSAVKNPNGIYSFPVDPNNFSLNMPFKYADQEIRYKALGLIRGATMTEGDAIYTAYRYYATGAEENRLERERIKTGENFYGVGSYYSFVYETPKNKKFFTECIGITCDPLPTGCNINLSYKLDGGTLTSVFTGFNTANAIEKKEYKKLKGQTLQLFLIMYGGTGTNRPFIKSLYVTGTLLSKI